MKFCSLVSGSSGNCQFIDTGKTKLLIDAGLSGKRIQELLKDIEIDAKDIDGIVVTHEHSDHIKGAGVLSRRFDIPIYANEGTWEGMEESIGKISSANTRIIDSPDFEIGDFGIETFDLYHDCNQPIGYVFHNAGKKIGVMMDTGRVDEDIRKSLKSCDLLMIEANHDVNMLKMGRYPIHLKKRIMSSWGHLSNDDSAEIITDLMTEDGGIVILGHLSGENNFPELAYATVEGILKQHGIDGLRLEIARRDSRTDIIDL